MADIDRPIHVDRRVSLRTPRSDRLQSRTVWLWDTRPLQARWQLSYHEFERAREDGLFGIHALELDDIPVPDGDVLVDVRYVGDEELPRNNKAIRTHFTDPDGVLRATESWEATGVRQAPRPPDGRRGTSRDTSGDNEPQRVQMRELSIESVRSPALSPQEREAADTKAYSAIGDITEELIEPVVDHLETENRPFEVVDDGAAISLTATIDGHEWEVRIEIAEDADGCVITSIHPEPLSGTRREEVADQLQEYNETVNRGGFEIDSEGGTVRFRTPVHPITESVGDALSENVTAMAEWYHLLSRK
ncbi:type III secretion system chaperone family protein [Halorubrum vacuolatum]|uniref:Sensory transduction regulator n=1 Tax=Halorubrum vacuolatum TaxID=63740 RepID=A0A238Y3W3_HALVU|nr:hypothetical protein [Halorubrum vacuolatum]SNR65481.1 hypothetical protein SAMN06264855_1294 [Halorubrum vacuolatum]